MTVRLAPVADGVASSLIRSVQDFGTSGERWPVEWLQSLITERRSDILVCLNIEAALPSDTLILRDLAVEVTRLLVDKLVQLASPTSQNKEIHLGCLSWPTSRDLEAHLAHLWGSLAARQVALGQPTEALASITEAVRIHRMLADTNPGAFFPSLARSLNIQGIVQYSMANRAAALTSSAESISIFRALAEINPDFLPLLANSLDNHGCWQGFMGQHTEALASIIEAVRIHRARAEANTTASLHDLAGSLSNQSTGQHKIGQKAEALTSIKEGVGLRRALAETNLDAFLPDLALSLGTQSNAQNAAGQGTEALASITEAVLTRPRWGTQQPSQCAERFGAAHGLLPASRSADSQELSSGSKARAGFRTCAASNRTRSSPAWNPRFPLFTRKNRRARYPQWRKVSSQKDLGCAGRRLAPSIQTSRENSAFECR